MATVSLTSVSKHYGNHSILKEITLHIEKGEFVVVVGPSGCGKSTLLRLVAGLEDVSNGNILINDRCVNKIPAARRDMAMVFQNYALYPHMTVYHNMAYGLKLRGMKKNLIRQRVEEVAAMLQLTEYLQRKPELLSGGQRQRVAMGRAIVRSPAVFLFDEPLSNLDAKLRGEMRHEIRKLQQQLDTTCLYVTHDQTEAMTMADRVVILNQGNIEQIGTPQAVYQHPATVFVAGFIGHYPMNFLPGKLDLVGKRIILTVGIELPLPIFITPVDDGIDVLIGIRPEHILIVAKVSSHTIHAMVECIDDMGSDKLLQLKTMLGDLPIAVRIFTDSVLVKQSISIELSCSKAILFNQHTGLRLGEWNE